MSRMLDLVRTNSLSWHHMMTASKGALQVPGEEMVEILVYIADHNKIMGEQARMTLAGWSEASAKAIAKAEMAQIGEKFRAMGEQIDVCRDGGEEE